MTEHVPVEIWLPNYTSNINTVERNFYWRRPSVLIGRLCLCDHTVTLIRAAYRVDTAILLNTRYERSGDESFLDEAISLEREALTLLPQGHTDRARYYGYLARSLLINSEHFPNEASVAQVISFCKESMTSLVPAHPKRWRALRTSAVRLK
jgi:hypothetical protein